MSKEQAQLPGWIEKIAERVPAEVAGPVVVLIAFLCVTPSVLDRMQDSVQVYCYLGILGCIAVISVIAMLLHGVSKYRERERKSWSKSIEQSDIIKQKENDLETRRQVEEAVASMEEKRIEQKEQT